MQNNYFIGVDVGGTKILSVLYRHDLDKNSYKILDTCELKTESDLGRSQVLKNLEQSIKTVESFAQKQKIIVDFIGVALPGFINKNDEVIEKLPNVPGFEGFNLADFLKKKFTVPIKISNDSRAFALAQQRVNFKKSDSLIGIIIGTGVGSGIVINQKVYKGSHNFGGEIGHQLFSLKTENLVDIGSLISGKSLEKFFDVPDLSEFLSQEKNLKNISENKPKNKLEEPDFKLLVLEKLESENILDFLALWLSNLCLVLNPEVVVIGGGTGLGFWSYFKEEIESKVNENLKNTPVELNLSFLKIPNAGALGAGLMSDNN